MTAPAPPTAPVRAAMPAKTDCLMCRRFRRLTLASGLALLALWLLGP